MPVNVIGTIKPKNNGKFPVAEAVDIKVTDNLRLDEALENKAELTTLNYALNLKADKTTAESLQAQINALITPVTQDAEVENARVDANGVTYTTLKERLDTTDSNIEDIYNSLNTGKTNINLGLTVSNNRLLSRRLPIDTFPITVLCDDTSYSFYIQYYNSSGADLSNTNWAKTEVTYTTYPTNAASFKVVCKKDDNSNLSSSDILHFSAYTIFKDIENIKNNLGNVSDDVELLNDTSDTIIKALNNGAQPSDTFCTFTLGLVHELNYNNPSSSINTAYSSLYTSNGNVIVTVKNGYKAIACFFDEDYNWVANTSWATGAFEFNPSTEYYCIEVRLTDNSNFTSENNPVNIPDVVKLTEFIGLAIPKGKCFVQTTGNDDNDGLTRDKPFATIQKAINSGFKTIIVREGTYTDAITLSDKQNINILLDHYYDHFSAGTDEDNPKIIIDGTSKSLTEGVIITRCDNCNLSNIEVKNVSGRGFKISNSSNLKFTDCIAHDVGTGTVSGTAGGFVITYTDADFYNCIAYNIGTTTAGTGTYHYDGFNIHGTGTTNFYNCSAWNCEDDGISHHDACYGTVTGGEWYNCGKGGIASPTHGAKVNISNVYCHNNPVGIYADNDSAVTDRGNIIMSNCVCMNNTKDMIIGDYYKVIAINCVYDTIQGSNNVTRYGIS